MLKSADAGALAAGRRVARAGARGRHELLARLAAGRGLVCERDLADVGAAETRSGERREIRHVSRDRPASPDPQVDVRVPVCGDADLDGREGRPAEAASRRAGRDATPAAGVGGERERPPHRSGAGPDPDGQAASDRPTLAWGA